MKPRGINIRLHRGVNIRPVILVCSVARLVITTPLFIPRSLIPRSPKSLSEHLNASRRLAYDSYVSLLLYPNALANSHSVYVDVGVKLGDALCRSAVACCHAADKVALGNGVPHLALAI